jgi:hypothetical protein
MGRSRNNDDTQNSGAGTLPMIAYVVAIGLILAYLVAVALAWGVVGEAAETWARRIELLGGLEALAFAAAGAVLGVTVQRPAVRAAEERAEASAQDARAGRAVIAAAEAKANRANELLENYREASRVEEGITTEFQQLVDIANRAGSM